MAVRLRSRGRRPRSLRRFSAAVPAAQQGPAPGGKLLNGNLLRHPIKVPTPRATPYDECGNVVEGSCSTVVTDGTITVEIAREYEDREDFFKKNGDGVFCVKETDPPILKWINLTMTFCNVDPYLVNLIAGDRKSVV